MTVRPPEHDLFQLTGITDVKLHLMQQNARQILDIVRGTFPGLPFDGTTDGNGCASLNSDGETIDCLWSRATKSSGPPGYVDGAEALRAYAEVC